MLSYIINIKTYYSIKSGLYLDFFYKKFIVFLMRTCFYNLSLFFLDKFLIEYLSQKIIITILYMIHISKTLQKLSLAQLISYAIYLFFTSIVVSHIILF